MLDRRTLLSLQLFSAEEIHRDQGLFEDEFVAGPQESGLPEIGQEEEIAVQEARQLAEFTTAVAKSTSEREPLIYGAPPEAETDRETTSEINPETKSKHLKRQLRQISPPPLKIKKEMQPNEQ